MEFRRGVFRSRGRGFVVIEYLLLACIDQSKLGKQPLVVVGLGEHGPEVLEVLASCIGVGAPIVLAGRGALLVCCCCVVGGGGEGAKSRHLTIKKLQKTLKACARGHEICRTVRSEDRVQWQAPHVCSNLYDRCH